MEEEKKEIQKTKNGFGPGFMVILVVLFLIGIGLGFAASKILDEPVKKDNTEEKEKKETKKEETTTKIEEKKNTVETRSCVGVYSGQGAISQDAQTGKNTMGTITVDLKDDGTYKITKGDMEQYWTGKYIIIENAVLLKEYVHTYGPSDNYEAYTGFLNIRSDCSKIEGGYGSIFFDSNFELTKQN